MVALGLACATGLVLLPATAAAPTDQYATFNHTDLTITDASTGLVWQRKPVFQSTQAAAIDFCATKYLQDGQAWRLPTMKELLTIVDETPHYEFEGTSNQPKMIDLNAFPATPTNFEYWSSSIVAGPSGNYGWIVRFHNGENDKQRVGLPGYVRCVRP